MSTTPRCRWRAARTRFLSVFVVPFVVALTACGDSNELMNASSGNHEARSKSFVPPATPGDREPTTPPLDAPSAGTVLVDIPASSSSDDWRNPLERFLGVPDDLDTAEKWNVQLMETAIDECMKRVGFEYEPVPFGSEVDPNVAYFSGLSADEQARYSLARWSTAGSGEPGQSCDAEASNRVHVLNVLGSEYQPYDEAFRQDKRIRDVTAAIKECVEAAGDDPLDPRATSRPICEQQARWKAVSSKVTEEVQTLFIQDHYDVLMVFLANRPKA
jgi:hypothetical protein